MKKKIIYTETGIGGEKYKKGDWKRVAVHTETEIKGFFGDYRFLSNFWDANVYLDGVLYKSVELAYQAAKWKPEDRAFFQTCSELESIKFNRDNKPNGYTPNQWHQLKRFIMKELVRQKFDYYLNPRNHQLLLMTGDKYLAELNWWRDRYWGVDLNGHGKNRLGEILMLTRYKILQQEFSFKLKRSV
jgi:ribA/ribD-fused uncharacterized protein